MEINKAKAEDIHIAAAILKILADFGLLLRRNMEVEPQEKASISLDRKGNKPAMQEVNPTIPRDNTSLLSLSELKSAGFRLSKSRTSVLIYGSTTNHVEEISTPLVFTPTLDGVPYADDDYYYGRKVLKVLFELAEQVALLQESLDSNLHFYLCSSRLLRRIDYDSILNSSHVISDLFIKRQAEYGYNFPRGLYPLGHAPPSPAFSEKLFPANPCSIKGKGSEALLTPSAHFQQIFDCSGRLPLQDDVGGINALPSDAGVDLKLGYPLDDVGGTSEHPLRAELHAYYKQWRAYIEDCMIVNSGARDSMLIQPVITLLGEAFGGALVYTLSSSSEPSQINTLARAGILIGVSLTVAGIGLHRFKCRLSENMIKVGAMGTALAIIVAFADLLPPWLARSVGAATSILMITGLAMI